ncbi:MAG: LptA/OstA family protein [Chthoniobacterales bacterium]
MTRKISALCSATLLCALPLQAQEQNSNETTPTMSPNTEKKEKGSGLGFDIMSKDRPEGAVTQITAKETATFNSENNEAEFIGSVVVTDPQFQMTCERLKAFMNEDRKGLDRVEATGDVIIRQENIDEAGKKNVSIARSGRAVFLPESGDIILTELPQIQQGINRHVATEKNTKMILNRAGRIRTEGGSRTNIVDTGDQK